MQSCLLKGCLSMDSPRWIKLTKPKLLIYNAAVPVDQALLVALQTQKLLPRVEGAEERLA